MEAEVDPEEENVSSVLEQESQQLFHILSCQSPSVIKKLYHMMPSDARQIDPAVTECITAMLEYFRTADATVCRSFLQCVCMLCENIPMHLESRLMSVAAYPTSDCIYSPQREPMSPLNTDGCEISGPSETFEEPTSPPSEPNIKRPRIDHWEQCIDAVRKLLLKRWERLKEHLVREVQLEDVWVSLRPMNRGRDRPDQTPGPADRGNRTPDSDMDYGFMESSVTLETFLQGSAGEVTVLAGQAGSGKTLLMSCLGQQWAHGLGPVPSSYLFVLLEFRQLNLLSRPLSLFELLFQHYLPPLGGEDEKRAILDYLLCNPEQSCWVLDGYDEFHSKITRTDAQGNRELLDPQILLPVAELISGLLSRQILPGCTVVVTCRLRDVTDLEDMVDKMAKLLGWECNEIEEYVKNFFGVKGHSASKALGKHAADLLLSSRHLLAMSSLPALCNICCMCLEHLLIEERQGGTEQSKKDERGGERRMKVRGNGDRGVQAAESSLGGSREQQGEAKGGRGRSDNTKRDGTNSRCEGEETLHSAQFSSYQIPSTLTQVYLAVLDAFLSHGSDKAEGDDKPKTTAFPQSPECTLTTLRRCQSEVCELSQLAWKGLEENKILFMEEEISQDVLKFSIRARLLTQVELRREDGMLVYAYCFIHLTVQEFLAALRIMTSNNVSDAQLKKRFSLKTRWTTRSDQRTVFTDSLHLYVCGLASPHCTATLVQLASASGVPERQSWVRKRQGLVLKLLKKLSLSNALTGPKILELCHCIQESQDSQLAKEVVSARPIMELRNIRLLPNDIDALAFVVNSADDLGIGLDFGACSMDSECLDVLPRCQYIHNLRFHGRKYDDKFAEQLSSILPKFTTLRKLEFCGASLMDMGAASLASALQNCPNITELNLSDNNLRDSGIRHIADIFTKLPRLTCVRLGQNGRSLKGVTYLIGKITTCLNIQHVLANGMKEVTVTFSQNSDVNSHKGKSETEVSLLNQPWSKAEMETLTQSLARCPALSVLDLSGGKWNVETLKSLAKFLPKLNITKKMILNDSCLSVEGLLVLTAQLSACPAVVELNIRLYSPDSVSIVFSGRPDQPAEERNKILCLSCCGLLPAHLGRVWNSLGSSSDITVLDLSSNSLGDKGLRKLLDWLPHLNNIQTINASNNDISMEGVVMLASALCSHDNLTEIHTSSDLDKQVILKFMLSKSGKEQQLKKFRVNQSSLTPSDMTNLCKRLVKCQSNLELDFSHSPLKDKAIENLLQVLPKMQSLQRLNVSHSIISTNEALRLLSCLNCSQRVTSVELRSQSESFICFDRVKSEQISCRFTHFSLSHDNMERLLEILEQGPQLSLLNLSNNSLENEGVKCFAESLPRLQITNNVNLSNNSLTQQGMLDVASTLCTCDSVSAVEVSLGAEERSLIWFGQYGHCGKTLSVRESSLKLDHVIRFVEILSDCPSLARLELKNNLVEVNWIEGLMKLLNSKNRECVVSIEESWITSEAAVNLVCRCLDLNCNIHTIGVHQNTLELSLMKSTALTAVSGDSTGHAPSLATQKISFVDCAVEGYQLAAMSSIMQRCPSLTELDLVIEGSEFFCSVLPSLPNLTTLSVGSKKSNVHVVLRLSEALLQSATIQHLNLSGHPINDRAAQLLARTLPRLRSVNLSHCECSTGWLQLLKALGQCVCLEGLCLSSVRLDEDSRVGLAHAIRNNTLIRRLKLNNIKTVMGTAEGQSVMDLLAAMEGLTQMQEMELEGWKMADRGIEQLTGQLPTWTNLRKISLSKNCISDQSGARLLEALRSCSQLEELLLSRNSLGDLTASRMALVLPLLTHLTVLDVSENRLGYEGSVSLSKALPCMKNLTKINLTSVGTSELCTVAASLAHCPLIQDVNFGWNSCSDNVAVELSKVLPRCWRLTRLDLEANRVSVCGAEALVTALQSCPSLQLIRLWRNNISSSETERLTLMDRRLSFSST